MIPLIQMHGSWYYNNARHSTCEAKVSYGRSKIEWHKSSQYSTNCTVDEGRLRYSYTGIYSQSGYLILQYKPQVLTTTTNGVQYQVLFTGVPHTVCPAPGISRHCKFVGPPSTMASPLVVGRTSKRWVERAAYQILFFLVGFWIIAAFTWVYHAMNEKSLVLRQRSCTSAQATPRPVTGTRIVGAETKSHPEPGAGGTTWNGQAREGNNTADVGRAEHETNGGDAQGK